MLESRRKHNALFVSLDGERINLDRKISNLIPPGAPAGGSVDGVQGKPDGGVALEARPKRHLPHPITLLHPPLPLTIRQLVPHGTRRSVSEPVKGHSRRFHVPVFQLQTLLHAVQHSSPSRVDAEVVECKLEVRHVRLDLRLQHLPLD